MSSPQFENRQAINQFCVDLAKDFLLVQGAGGNISSKEGEVLWIKASGTWLAEAKKQEIFIPISKNEVDRCIHDKKFYELPKALNGSELRPSIETWLHALMPQNYVVHLHALDILAILVHEEAISELNSLSLAGVRWGFVHYAKPGPDLALAVSQVMKEKEGLEVLFLQNHGIVLAANSIDRISELLDYVRSECAQPVANLSLELHQPESANCLYKPVEDSFVHSLATNTKLLKLVRSAWAIAPDHVVFLGAAPAIAQDLEELTDFEKLGEDAPLIVFVEDIGVYSRNVLDLAGQQQLRAYFEILIRQKTGQKFNTFNEAQIGELLNWDAEKYRLAMRK